jgi:site-specific DNA-methyltransferase (adenine-specific)
MIKLYKGNCFDALPHIANESVDCIITDPPYGITGQEFDKPLDLALLWEHYKRVTKPNAAIIFFSMQPFTTDLINSNRKWFRYELIIEKTHAQGFMNAKRAPLKAHENVLLFANKTPVYNPQMTEGKPYTIEYKRNYDVSNYGRKECGRKGTTLVNNGTRYPRSVMKVSNANMKMKHPQGKPVDYLRWLIRTYTNPDMTILDTTFGACSCGAAVMEEGSRNFIGMELSDEWFQKGVHRLKEDYGATPEIYEL